MINLNKESFVEILRDTLLGFSSDLVEDAGDYGYEGWHSSYKEVDETSIFEAAYGAYSTMIDKSSETELESVFDRVFANNYIKYGGYDMEESWTESVHPIDGRFLARRVLTRIQDL